MKDVHIERPDPERLREAMRQYAEAVRNSPSPVKCNCDRIGCPYDHSEHYRRRAALNRLIARELKKEE
jgi:hypothetical protein